MTDHVEKRATSVSCTPNGIRQIYDANCNLKVNEIFFYWDIILHLHKYGITIDPQIISKQMWLGS